MDILSIVLASLAVLVVVQVIRLIFADGDLSLMWTEKFGKKPEVLHGEVAWITGASSGIGEFLAYELARVGCKLVLSARREAELTRVKKQCLLSGTLKDEDVLILPFDATDIKCHKDMTDQVINHFEKIDILVNNAGRSQRATVAQTDIEVDRQMFQLNSIGPISLTKAVLPHMLARKKGHLVVTSSIAGKFGVPFSATYSATKFALHGWFEALRVETHSDNIGITMVCPGPVRSQLLEVAFTGEVDKQYGQQMQPNEKRMKTERCAELMAISIANKLPEVWISLHPPLIMAYFAQYFPSIAKRIACKMGMKIFTKIREDTHTKHGMRKFWQNRISNGLLLL